VAAVDETPVVALVTILVTGIFDQTDAKDLMPAVHSFRSGRPRWWRLELAWTDPDRRSAVAGDDGAGPAHDRNKRGLPGELYLVAARHEDAMHDEKQ
jgi:hypothetical protein